MNFSKENIKDYLKRDSIQIYREILINENYFKKNANKIDVYIIKSTSVSKIRYKDLIDKYGKLDVNEYFKIFNIELNEVYEENPFSFPYFAIYDVTSNKIDININLIKQIKKIIKSNEIENIISYKEFYNLVLLHELFHYLDERDKKFDNNNFSVQIEIFKHIKINKTLNILKEIAAIEFSKIFLDIEYNPVIFECLIS
ncbi:MAG: hypothetical protein WAO56_00140 [Miniphocaeibacter sp.]|uniref:hypothetical protein n=1 Tax=Miniphocaeibacter sp. TaxID=3100973 RepID=UPI0017A39ACB|nr:hypothetical protein [Gallicola sp.]